MFIEIDYGVPGIDILRKPNFTKKYSLRLLKFTFFYKKF